MKDWPAYPYPAQKLNPFSAMAKGEGRLYFVHCCATAGEALATGLWLSQFDKPGRSRARCLYHNGRPWLEVTRADPALSEFQTIAWSDRGWSMASSIINRAGVVSAPREAVC